jgi:hypothetical protein
VYGAASLGSRKVNDPDPTDFSGILLAGSNVAIAREHYFHAAYPPRPIGDEFAAAANFVMAIFATPPGTLVTEIGKRRGALH